MVLDDTVLTVKSERLVKCDWSEFYPDAAELIPGNVPEAPRGKEVVMSIFVDVDHTSCQETQQSHSEILIQCQSRSNCLVLETTEHCCGIINVWIGVAGEATCDQND